jgi:hypothetical protein
MENQSRRSRLGAFLSYYIFQEQLSSNVSYCSHPASMSSSPKSCPNRVLCSVLTDMRAWKGCTYSLWAVKHKRGRLVPCKKGQGLLTNLSGFISKIQS